MKKVIITCAIALLSLIIFPQDNVFGISDNFKFVIDTIGIPRYNVYGDEINEEIYNIYNVFSYSNPVALIGKIKTQRFKALPVYGKWTQNGGPYKGSGIQGEYYVVGTSYSGQAIDNVYFPVDARPSMEPNCWNYVSFNGAYESWFDKNNYKSEEQLEFMKNTQMLFDADNFKNPPTGKLDLAAYGIYANGIGLNKARLNTSSTWKTMGIISTKKKDAQGRIWDAIFSTAPMAASANIKSSIVADNVTLDEKSEYLNIPIKFMADAINLNNYAKEKHIKQISSTIYINGKKVATITSSKTKHIEKQIEFKIDRQEYNISKTYPIHIKVESYLYTEFSVDGLMQDSIEKDIYVKVDPKKIVPVKDLDIKNIEKSNNTFYVKPLIKSIQTQSYNSLGIIETGRFVACKLNLNLDASQISNIECNLNNNKLPIEVINKQDDKLVFKFNLDKNIANTISSWNYLRNVNNNYLNVDFNKVGMRIKNPNILTIYITINGRVYIHEIKFDTIDNYNININYTYDKDIINKNELNNKKEIQIWMKS